ncbi:MAG: acylglycerol lipase, partial [Marivirga sp.]
LAFQPPKFKVMLGNIVADIIPTYTEQSDLDIAEISTIKEEVQRYAADELNHKKISAKLFQQISRGGINIQTDCHKINQAVFLAHGELDLITSFEASQKLAEQCEKISWHPYENSKHEIHHDEDKGALLNDIYHWINDPNNH